MNQLEKIQTFRCPECESDRVTLKQEQMFMANTSEHYCYSVKTQDSDAKSRCLDCDWRGTRDDLHKLDIEQG